MQKLRPLSSAVPHVLRSLGVPFAYACAALSSLVCSLPAQAAPLGADFNGDGHADLAIGAPGESVGTVSEAGAVHVIYGSSAGLSATLVPNEIWTQDSPGIPDAAEPNDRFGSTLSIGDFNGDSFSDLAIGVHLEDVDGLSNAGAVHIVYGSAWGLSAKFHAAQIFTENSLDVEGVAEHNDQFASALVAGDFNGDGCDDLALGAPYELSGTEHWGGAVNVIYGSPDGMSATYVADQVWTQDSPGVADVTEADDYFGGALAAADFNADGYEDLAIATEAEDVGKAVDAGSVNVIYGGPSGLSVKNWTNQFWTQDSPDVEGVAEGNDYFGRALTAADFNGDGIADLAIGVSAQKVGSLVGAGAVNVIYGSRAGLSATAVPDQLWTQNSLYVPDVAESGDNFGSTLTTGDFNSDGYSDLAIGVPSEDAGAIGNSGAVNVIYGASGGLSASAIPAQVWSQNAADVEDSCESNDFFGRGLSAADFDGDGFDDLVIGAWGEDLAALNVGVVHVIHGFSLQYGLSATWVDDELWHQDAPFIEDTAEASDVFGHALAAR